MKAYSVLYLAIWYFIFGRWDVIKSAAMRVFLVPIHQDERMVILPHIDSMWRDDSYRRDAHLKHPKNRGKPIQRSEMEESQSKITHISKPSTRPYRNLQRILSDINAQSRSDIKKKPKKDITHIS
jgi:hypothetical protein